MNVDEKRLSELINKSFLTEESTPIKELFEAAKENPKDEV